DLRIIRKQGDDAAALVEVEQARHTAHALADIRAGPGDFFDRFEEFLRDEVGICVNAHEQTPDLERLPGRLGFSPRSWPGLSRPPPLFLLRTSHSGRRDKRGDDADSVMKSDRILSG